MLYFILGGLVSADTDAAWQSMVSQPMVACTAVGLLMGDIHLGVTVGLLLQLPYLVEIPVGGTSISLGNLGALVASGVALHLSPEFAGRTNLVLVASLAWGIVVSWAGAPSVYWLRYLNLILTRSADKEPGALNPRQITLLNTLGVLGSVIFGILFCALFFWAGETLVATIVAQLPQRMDSTLFLVKPVLIGAGLGAVSRLFLNKRSGKFAIFGLLTASLVLLVLHI